MSVRPVELIPHTRLSLIVGWAAVAGHVLALTGILILITTH